MQKRKLLILRVTLGFEWRNKAQAAVSGPCGCIRPLQKSLGGQRMYTPGAGSGKARSQLRSGAAVAVRGFLLTRRLRCRDGAREQSL